MGLVRLLTNIICMIRKNIFFQNDIITGRLNNINQATHADIIQSCYVTSSSNCTVNNLAYVHKLQVKQSSLPY